MAVVFGSPAALIRQPGAYSVVDASQLAFTPAFAYNVVAVLGAGLGGAPLVPYALNDAVQASELFGAGTPLADAIRLAFQGGSNGGAASVIGLRIDNTSQASGALSDPNSGTALEASFKDFGAYGNTYSISFYPGSVTGTAAMIQGKRLDGSNFSQTIDNYTSFSRLVQKINQDTPINLRLTGGGVKASQTVAIATSQVDGRATLTSNQGSQLTNQAYIYQYPASLVENTADSMRVAFSAPISWAIDSIDALTDTIVTVGNHGLLAGAFVYFSGDTLPTGINPEQQYVVHAAPTASSLQVAIASSANEQWAATLVNANQITVPGHGLANGDVIQVDGSAIPTGLFRGRNYFVVSQATDLIQVAATAGGTPINITGVLSNCLVRRVAVGTLVDISGAVSNAIAILDPGLATVSASNPTAFNGARAAAQSVPGYSKSVTGATITASAYSSDSARIQLQNGETWGHDNGRALPGTLFTIASGTYQGTYQILHFEWDGLASDNTRVVRKLTGDRVLAEGVFTGSLAVQPSIGFPRLQPATEALATLLPANGLLATGGQYITIVVGDTTVYYTTGIGDTIQLAGQEIADQINANSDSPVVASAAYNPSTYTNVITLLAKEPGTIANTLEVRALVNAQTMLLITSVGARLTGGVDPAPPRSANGTTSGTIILANGFDSVPTYQRWTEGLDVLRNVPVRWIVPTTDDIGVQSLCVDHAIAQSATPRRRERLAILGHGSGWSRQQIRERAEFFQSERAIFVSPCEGRFLASDGLTGNLRPYPHYYAAAIAAGMLAAEGNGISDPITHTFLRNVVLERTYQPGSIELDQMIESGVLTFERDPSVTRQSRGFRVTRAITTYRVVGTSALRSNAFESISVINQSDFIAAAVREMEEAIFIGQAIFPDTLEAIRVAVNLELNRRSRERIIYGYDPEFTQVALSPDSPNAVNVAYKIYPAPALEFVLNTQLLFPIPAE